MFRISVLLAGAIVVSSIGLAQDYDITPIAPGETHQATLDDASHTFLNGARFDVYRLDASQGQRLIAEATSNDFIPVLVFVRPVGGVTEFLRESYGERILLRPPTDGMYYLVVQTDLESDGGAYELTLSELPPAPDAVPRPIAVGETARAMLTDNDPLLPDSDQEIFYHLYALEAEAGQELTISMESVDMDAYLMFGPLTGNVVSVTDIDDDGGMGTDALLRITIPADGTYGIMARTYGEGSIGTYVLTVAEPPPPVTRSIERNTLLTAELGHHDSVLPNRGFYHQWSFEGRAGEEITVRMRSDDVDTYLFLGRLADDGTFEELAYNDDAPGDGTNSLIEFTLPEDGEYLIRATTFSGHQTGTYSLELY